MTEDPDRPDLRRRILFAALLGLFVYAALAAHRDARGVLRALRQIPPWAPLLMCALSLANYAIRFPRWQRYLEIIGSPTRGKASALIYLSGLSLTVSPGKVGEAIKSWALRREDGTALATSAPIVLAERITDLFGFLVLILVFGLAAASLRAPTPLEVAITLVAFVLGTGAAWMLVSNRIREAALRMAARVPLLRPRIDRGRLLLDSGAELLHPRELPRATLLASLGWGLECIGAFIVARSVLPEATTPELGLALVGYSFAVAAVAGAVVVIAPGGLGVTEGLFAALLTTGYRAEGLAMAEASALALSVTFVVRLCTLWLGMAVGLVALWCHRRALSTRP